MFTSIQKKLLLRHPILWNTRIVPLFTVMLAVNFVFFVAGFIHGAIDFSIEEDYYRSSNLIYPFVFLASAVIGLVALVVWAVYYLKNNSFKSFYPRSRFSLFKEWLLLLIGFLMIVMTPVTFMFAEGFRQRCYYSEDEVDRRMQTIEMASFFIDGPYESRDVDSLDTINRVMHRLVYIDFRYRDRVYSVNSLMNKECDVSSSNYYNFQTASADRQRRMTEKIRSWLYENKKDSVRNLMVRYLDIADEHQLKHSVTPDQWLSMVYDYPTFEQYAVIRKVERFRFDQSDVVYSNEVMSKTDLEPDQTYRRVGKTEWVYNKNFVPAKAMRLAYDEIKRSYTNKYDVFNWILVVFHFALFFSLVVFSYRVTSGKSFLIAIVTTGILTVVETIVGFSVGGGVAFGYIVLLTLLAFDLYYFVIPKSSGRKKWSGVSLNILLWQIPSIIWLVYYCIIESIKNVIGYRQYEYDLTDKVLESKFPVTYFVDSEYFRTLLAYSNVVIVLIIVAALTVHIRKWRGVPED